LPDINKHKRAFVPPKKTNQPTTFFVFSSSTMPLLNGIDFKAALPLHQEVLIQQKRDDDDKEEEEEDAMTDDDGDSDVDRDGKVFKIRFTDEVFDNYRFIFDLYCYYMV
jgi:hypothetical protein